MTLLTTREILAIPNEQGGFAVGAFNVHNMEYTQGVIAAAEQENAPVILMIGQAMIPFAGLDMLAAICLEAANKTAQPVAVALDHGTNHADIMRCLELGISIMYDGSHYPFEENIARTRQYCELAHARGLSVEGELGSFAGSEDGEAEREELLTDPEKAAEFVERTGVDILAASIGNYHGLHKFPPKIDVDRLRAIRARTTLALAMHGGSDLPEGIAEAVIQEGMSKFNIGTDLKYAFSRALKEVLSADPLPFQPPHVLAPARDRVCEVAREKMRSFNSSGKADLYTA